MQVLAALVGLLPTHCLSKLRKTSHQCFRVREHLKEHPRWDEGTGWKKLAKIIWIN